MQTNPKILYRAFLDLDGANMLSILSFDSHSLRYLMDDKFEDHFTKDFPLIYKNKITKSDHKSYYFRSALDNALKYNQIRAATLICEYIRKYQIVTFPPTFSIRILGFYCKGEWRSHHYWTPRFSDMILITTTGHQRARIKTKFHDHTMSLFST